VPVVDRSWTERRLPRHRQKPGLSVTDSVFKCKRREGI
jgi:hypothetical protein